jgi:sulfur-oxidizing protein SoxY
MKRRILLKAGLQVALTGIIIPGAALAEYPTKAFLARETPEALREAFGTADIGATDKIEIEAPHIASDANMVPVRIRSGFVNTESISLVVAGNESPFTAVFKLYESQNFVSTRIRMTGSSDLLVIVKADGMLHTSTRPIRVGRNRCEA